MGKRKIQTHHLYLGVGGMLAVSALVIALTFGLSSAQSGTCPDGSPMPLPPGMCPGMEQPTVCPPDMIGTPPNCQMATCPAGMTGVPPACVPEAPVNITCPNGVMAPTYDQCPKCPDGVTVMPAGGACPIVGGQQPCPDGTFVPVGTSCPVAGGGNDPCPADPCPGMCCGSGTDTYPPTGGCPAPMPTAPCTNGAYMCEGSAWVCRSGGTTTQSCPSTMPIKCSDGRCAMTQLECTSGQQPGGNQCMPGQFFCQSQNACLVTGTPCPTSGGQCPAGQFFCTLENMCKTTGMSCNPVTSPGTCTGPMPTTPCGSAQHYNCVGGRWSCISDGSNGTGIAPGGLNCPMGKFPCYSENVCKDPGAACRDSGGQIPQYGDTTRPVAPQCMPGDPFCGNTNRPGENCPTEMQSCDDLMMPGGNKVCMPKYKYDWDQSTQTSVRRAATCAEMQQPQGGGMMGPGMGGPGMMGPGMTGPGMMGQGFGFGFGTMGGPGMTGPGMMGQGQQGQMMNPCEMNPNDPFCKAGFDFGAMQQQYQFDPTQFDTQDYQVKNLKQELRNLKQEAQGWQGDIKQVNAQLADISKVSGGFACPVAVEVQSIVQQLQDAVAKVKSLNEKSSTEEIQSVLALRDFVNGRWNMSELVTEGLRQKLFGGQMGVPGKMQALDGCRQISGRIQEACDMSKNLTREYEKAKKSNAPAAILKAFDSVLKKLQQRCTNPLAALQESGVSFDTLVQPWPNCNDEAGMEELSNKCSDYMPVEMMCMQMGGPGMGPMGGPMGGPGMGPMGGPMGGPGMGPMGGPGMGMGMGPMMGGPGDMGMIGPPPAECMPPSERYLGVGLIMQELDQARMGVEKHFQSMNVCEMLKMAQDYMSNSTGEEEFGPPQEIVDLIEPGLQACEEGDTETLAMIQEEMMNAGPGPGGPGMKGRKMGLGGMVDIDKLVEDKLNAKLASMFEEDDARGSGDKLAALEARVAELQAKLDDASKTILALNEKLSEMTTKLAANVELDAASERAISSITKMPDEEVQQSVASSISDLADKIDQIKLTVPAEADELIDNAMNTLIQSPPTTNAVSDIKDSLTEIQSLVASGATKAEIVAKVKEEVENIKTLNAGDVANKVASNICAASDTCNFGDWYAMPVLAAKTEGFVAADTKEFKPGEPETKCAAITRVARIMEKAGELDIDLENKAPVAGAPEWCRPFIHAMQGEGVAFAEGLKDPNAPADRLDIAILMSDALGDKLPTPPNADEYLTPDVKNLPLEAQMAIAQVRYNGIMDTTDGTNFSPDGTFNRAQNALVTTKASDAVTAAGNE